MCGIAGIAGIDDLVEATAAVRRMTTVMARRGPDAEGVECFEDAVLGHRRLAIFDLSDAGRQPMVLPDRSVAVVFNGAIYNFHKLRAELQQAGCQFRSRSDTEVLLHGYRVWGIDALISRLRGMFAIALWDARERKLWLVRDRLGVKPLVYAVRNGSIAFASTVTALGSAGLAGDIDPQAVFEFLEFGYVTDDRAIYSRLRKAPAGTILEWHDGTLRTREYWQVPAPHAAVSFEDAAAETEKIFVDAVRLRLEADVPVGALLSGGVDSSLVCWAIASLGGNIRAFTIATPGDPWDESAGAVQTARDLGIAHEVIPIAAQDVPDMDEFIRAYDEPFACSSALGMLRVSRAVRTKATVLLTGDGGDDVFLGYPEHRRLWMAQRLALRMPAGAAQAWPAIRKLLPKRGSLKRAQSFVNYITGGLGEVARAHDGLPVYRRLGLLGPRLRDAQVPQRNIAPSVESARNLLAEFLAYDRRTRFVGEYMTKVDRATMWHALEARSPFLDHELWTFAASLPFDVRLRGGVLKAVLREIARRRIGPRIASSPKRGFGVPVQRWIAAQWNRRFREDMRDSILGREGYIDAPATVAALDASARRGWAPNQLWYLFVLEHWMRRERGAGAGVSEPAPVSTATHSA